MRFTIATTLMVDSFSSASSLDLHFKAVELLTRKPYSPSDGDDNVHDAFPSLKRVKDMRKTHTRTDKVQELLADELFHKDNVHSLKNVRRPIECDPHQDGDADIGVLSCGSTQYCVESNKSSLGGFCTPRQDSHDRQLQRNITALDSITLLCNLDQSSPDVNCETCTTDEAAYTGEFSCVYTSDCVNVPGLCGDAGQSFDFCGVDNLKGVVNGQEYYHRESCFEITSPVQFSYCDSVTIKGEELECTQSINGVDCNTCTFYYIPETGGFCQAFDCTNTELGVEGNDCTISLVGALAFGYMYEKLPCPNGCSLCGAGLYMSTSTNDFTTDNGQSVNCFGYQMNALTGDFATNDFCQSLTDNVQEPCGCVANPNGNGTNSPGSTDNPGPTASPGSAASAQPTVMAMAVTMGASIVMLGFGGVEGFFGGKF
jgi:hypothetical protein